MFDGSEFALDRALYLLELSEVDVELTVIEMTLLDWVTNGLEFLELLLIFFLGCCLTCLIKPLNNLINLLQERFPLWLSQIFLECSIGIKIGPHLVGVCLEVVSELFPL